MNFANHPALPSPDAADFDGSRRAEITYTQVGARNALQPHYGGSGYGPEYPDSGDSAGGLVDYFRMLRHKTAIMITSFAGLLIGFGIGIPMKPVYRARTSIEVLNLNEDFMNMKQTNPVTTNDSSEDTSEEETQTKLLQSEALMKRVLEKLNPGAQPSRKPRMATSGWRSWFPALHDRWKPTERERKLNSLAGSLKVRTTSRTRIIEVRADSTDARLAADFVNTLIQEFVQQNMEARFATTGRATG